MFEGNNFHSHPLLTAALTRVTWTPNGRELIFGHGGGAYNSLRQIPLEGGQPRNIGPQMLSIGTRGVSIHPNGRLLAFHAYSGKTQSEVWVLENLLRQSK